jgi:hypothetical protein
MQPNKGLHSGKLQPCLQGWKRLKVQNALAFYDTELIVAVELCSTGQRCREGDETEQSVAIGYILSPPASSKSTISYLILLHSKQISILKVALA